MRGSKQCFTNPHPSPLPKGEGTIYLKNDKKLSFATATNYQPETVNRKPMLFSIYAWILISIFTIIIGPITFAFGLFDPSGDMAHRCARIWGKFICLIAMVKVDVRGIENISPDQAQIFVSNHQSFFDIFVLNAYLPIQFRWIAKESLFRIPFVGWGMRACGYISVDRSNKKKAMASFIKTLKKLKEGKSVIIFPEGSRAVENEVGKFKKGSLLLAKRSKVPVVPLTIIGSSQVLKKGSVKIVPGRIRVIFDKPINTKYLDRHCGEELMETVKKIFVNNLKGR